MSTVKLENLKSDLSFNGDLQLDKNFILLPAKAVVSDDLIKVLTDWNFTESFTEDTLLSDDALVSCFFS